MFPLLPSGDEFIPSVLRVKYFQQSTPFSLLSVLIVFHHAAYVKYLQGFLTQRPIGLFALQCFDRNWQWLLPKFLLTLNYSFPFTCDLPHWPADCWVRAPCLLHTARLMPFRTITESVRLSSGLCVEGAVAPFQTQGVLNTKWKMKLDSSHSWLWFDENHARKLWLL